jgi:hypothetical protein
MRVLMMKRMKERNSSIKKKLKTSQILTLKRPMRVLMIRLRGNLTKKSQSLIINNLLLQESLRSLTILKTRTKTTNLTMRVRKTLTKKKLRMNQILTLKRPMRVQMTRLRGI